MSTDPTPAIVLIHGFPGGSSDFDPLIQHLVERGWDPDAILAPTLAGFGDHAGVVGFDDLWVPAQDDHLQRQLPDGGRPLVLVGHDLGGPIALELAVRLAPRVRGVVLASCNLLADPPLPGPFRLIGVPALGALVKAATMSRPSLRAMAVTGRRSGPTPRPNTADEARAIRTIFATALADPVRHFGPVEAALAAYAGPTTHVIGARDPFFTVAHASRQAGLARASRLEVLDGVGHFPQLEAPARMAALIEAVAAAPVTP